MSPMWFDAIQILFLLLVTSVLTYLVFSWRKTSVMAKEIDDLTAQLNDLKAQNALLLDRTAKFDATNLHQLQAELKSTQDQSGRLNAEIGGLREQHADSLLRIQALQSFETKYNNLSSQFTEVENQNNSLRLQLQQADADSKILIQKLSDLTAHYNALDERYNALLKSSNELRTEVDTMELRLVSANTDNNRLGNENKAMTLQIGELEAGSTALIQNIARFQADIDQLKSETEVLNGQLDSKDAFILTLQNQLAGINAAHSGALGLGGNLNSANTDSTDLEALVEALSIQIGELEMNKVETETKVSNLTNQMTEKTGLLATLQGKVDSLTVRLADKETLNNRLSIDLDDCRKKYKATAQELSEEEKKLEEIRAKIGTINFDRIGNASEANKDDLKLIKGIGPFIERKLNALGIYTFRQIANFTDEDVERITDVIEFFPSRIVRDNWVGQAGGFVKGEL